MSDFSQPAKLSRDALLRVGRSVRVFAVVVILLLSASVLVIAYSQLRQSVALAEVLANPNQVLGGFVLLMLLTIGYLVGKGWSTSRYQRRLIDQLLEEEATARAQRLDPITQFHHPDVCRDILLRQASYANRLQSSLSLVELTVPNLFQLSLDAATRPLTEELVRQIRRLCRPIDSVLRWTPDSFLLVFPEVTRQELPGVSLRIRAQLEKWAESQSGSSSPEFHFRGVTSDSLGLSGEILLEVRRLMVGEQPGVAPTPEAANAVGRREKSISLAIGLQVKGMDRAGQSFEEPVITERVAADRVWFPLKKNLAAYCDLTIRSHDGSLQEVVTVTRLLERGGEQLVEAQFAKTPENWVVREA
jgi:GGDEF domain-containing protein